MCKINTLYISSLFVDWKKKLDWLTLGKISIWNYWNKSKCVAQENVFADVQQLPLDVTTQPEFGWFHSFVKQHSGINKSRLLYLRVENQLLLIKVQQSHRVRLGVVYEDLQAGIQGRPLTVRTARKHTLEHLLRTQHRHHLEEDFRMTVTMMSPLTLKKKRISSLAHLFLLLFNLESINCWTVYLRTIVRYLLGDH